MFLAGWVMQQYKGTTIVQGVQATPFAIFNAGDSEFQDLVATFNQFSRQFGSDPDLDEVATNPCWKTVFRNCYQPMMATLLKNSRAAGTGGLGDAFRAGFIASPFDRRYATADDRLH
jgi:hypothetical protein